MNLQINHNYIELQYVQHAWKRHQLIVMRTAEFMTQSEKGRLTRMIY